MTVRTLVKVGGSLYHQPELRGLGAAWAALGAKYPLLFLPGGGPFANGVRVAGERFALSDDAAHWMAILAMDQYAYLLADLVPGAALVNDLAGAAVAAGRGQVAILAPSALLRRADPLPHSWEVTSDSLAAWLAGCNGIELLVLLKSVAGIYPAGRPAGSARPLRRFSAQNLAGSEVVDPYFSRVLPPGLRCWLLDGRRPERLRELLAQGETIGTEVVNCGNNPKMR